MSVNFARLREAFDPTKDAEAAFLCTFGLDIRSSNPRSFRPSFLPASLSTLSLGRAVPTCTRPTRCSVPHLSRFSTITWSPPGRNS